MAPNISLNFIFSLKTNIDRGIMVTGTMEVIVEDIPAEVYLSLIHIYRAHELSHK